MPPTLLRFAAVVAGNRPDRPVVAIGVDPRPTAGLASPLTTLPAAAGTRLAAAVARGDVLGDEAMADAGLPAGALTGAVAVLVPGRLPGWTTLDAIDLARVALPAARAVIVAGQASGLARTPAGLTERLLGSNLAPCFAGWLPPDDDDAPGGPVALLQDLPPAPGGDAQPPATALLDGGDDPAAVVGTLAELAADGIDVVVAASDAAVIETANGWRGRGVVAVERCERGAVASTLADRADGIGRGWLIEAAANEPIAGPWPDLGLRATLGRYQAAGWTAAGATTLLAAPDPATGAERCRFALPPATFRPVARLVGGDGEPAPFNLLRRRALPSLPAPAASGWALDGTADGNGWADWDDGFAERYLVERLTGHGIFSRRFPTPPRTSWFAEERLATWAGSVLKAGLGRLPRPDPLAPQPGVLLVRWDAPDGAPGSLFVAPPGGPEALAGRGVRGTISVGDVQPGGAYHARLYRDDARSALLAELRFGVTMDLDE